VFTRPDAAIQCVCYTASNQRERTPEAAANARLIAAAPDLLDMLKQTLIVLAADYSSVSRKTREHDTAAFAARVETAIAKAEGRQ